MNILAREFFKNLMTFFADLWHDVKRGAAFTFTRERRCAWDGRRIVGEPHRFFGNDFCSRLCAHAQTVAQIEQKAREAAL